jgi:hypothetical protein
MYFGSKGLGFELQKLEFCTLFSRRKTRVFRPDVAPRDPRIEFSARPTYIKFNCVCRTELAKKSVKYFHAVEGDDDGNRKRAH